MGLPRNTIKVIVFPCSEIIQDEKGWSTLQVETKVDKAPAGINNINIT
jgi:hypothetical protein